MKTPESVKKAIVELKRINESSDDPERAHSQADGVLCEVLDALGHHEVVDAWRAITPKWYA